jgi:hypothetical protein
MDFPSIDNFWIELLKAKSNAFKKDAKPSFADFKKYLKEFYSALLFFKRLDKLDNAVFCGISVRNHITIYFISSICLLVSIIVLIIPYSSA